MIRRFTLIQAPETSADIDIKYNTLGGAKQ